MNRSSPVGMMLQFAFGPGSANAKLSSVAATHATGTMDCETSSEMLLLAATAKAWWESRRPHGWTLEQHLADSAAGCNGTEEERALAKAVAACLRQDALAC